MTDTKLIAGEPGFVGSPAAPNEWSADADLELFYAPGDGGTVASLIITSYNVENGHPRTAGIELTDGGLQLLINTGLAIRAAVAEDAR